MSTSELPRKPYIIQAEEVPERYGRGWYTLGLAKDFDEKPVRFDYFGQSIVAFRGESGDIHVLDAFCPHMGADLSLGCVEGESLRCPFHEWRWRGEDGVCDDIPYAKRIPPRAVMRSYPTMVKNQLVFMWYDPEMNPPIPEQEPEKIDAFYSDEWTDWQIEKMTIHTNSRELVDNMADVAHFHPVHGAPCSSFKNIVKGHTYQQVFIGGSETLAEDGGLTSVATYEGPGYMHTYMTGQMEGQPIESRLLVSHVPIDTNSFDLRFGVAVKKYPGLSDEENEAIAQSYVEANRAAFFQDVDVWHTKTRIDNPLLCDGDGPINKLRKWYNQFYVDVAEVGNAWDEQKEYEVAYQHKGNAAAS